jgi:hypothetical protein
MFTHDGERNGENSRHSTFGLCNLTYAQDLACLRLFAERWPSSFLLVRVPDVDCVSSALDSYAPLAVVGCKCL